MLKNYPRPQMIRKEWSNLNGEWDFVFDDKGEGMQKEYYNAFPQSLQIQVPYTYETEMSGVHVQEHHELVWYHRKFQAPDRKGHLLLHFEGADFETTVWINGRQAGTHLGGYAAFSLDITEWVWAGENDVTVLCRDSRSCMQPRGKQRWKDENFGCWYVQTTGIWKTVWLEQVGEVYVKNVRQTPDIDRGEIEFDVTLGGCPFDFEGELDCEISFEGRHVARQRISIHGKYKKFTVELQNAGEVWEVQYWSPGSPKLYDVSFVLFEHEKECDRLSSYFGMRKIAIENGQVLLNNVPVYQRLILDQGYWKESGLTPPSDEAFETDLDLIVSAGYNGLRKHQKTADRVFLSLCDKKGILVWSEMAAAYGFHDDAAEEFTREWMEIVRQNYNSPSIITWTPFNESWGLEHIFTDKSQQRFTEAIYHLTKTFDPMRPVIVNDGWEHTVSDIITLHDYAENGSDFADRYTDKDAVLANQYPFNLSRYAMAKGYPYRGQPVIISEYGGIAFTSESGWGYGNQVKTEEAFLKRFEDVTSAIKSLPYVCGFCYTQVTDVEQEINGLFTADRKPKMDIGKIREINLS